ncbi:MAG TPA: CDP-alcohol phosphatidyltransferase family protein [Vicinamibacterales bacterium]|nr:CDP-alcohol phosphatidyltransferase family protein [Vicinamibacterales bacterium]
MYRIAALIVDDCPGLRFAGLDLADRAQRLARRAGVTCVHVVADERPFADLPLADLLLVLPTSLIAEPKAIVDLLRRGLQQDEDAVAVADAHGRDTGLMLLSFEATERVRPARHLRSARHRLAVECALRTVRIGTRFVRRLRDAADVARMEVDYLRHVNGGDGEGWFTRNIRACSIPVSRRLLRWSIGPNQVTIVGFVLAVLAGLSFARGGYWAGVAGALLYWTSMVFDCCDGEVARGSLRESSYGAWLETVTDYLSYFVVLGGIVWGDVRLEGFDHHTTAAVVAALASLAIVLLVGYLRARVAASNPGAFDDALAAELQRGTVTQRFAVWGRQLIKRSFMAHLIVVQAAIGFIPALTEIWAYGAVAALVIVAAVHTHIIRSVRVQPFRPAISL